MIDKNERLSYLDTRHTNETVKRVIANVLKSYVLVKGERISVNTAFYKEKEEAIRNSLFLKYTGIEFESIFQSMYKDKKFNLV